MDVGKQPIPPCALQQLIPPRVPVIECDGCSSPRDGAGTNYVPAESFHGRQRFSLRFEVDLMLPKAIDLARSSHRGNGPEISAEKAVRCETMKPRL